MKRINLKSVLFLIFLMLNSCNETVVTNIVHNDGSVTRRIVLRDQDKKSFQKENLRVPFDESWSISDTIEVNDKGDTTWVRKAEKLFKNVDEINREYANDSGSNKDYKREARFSKRFRWFTTLYTFSENIEKTFSYGYPVEQYLTKQELEYFYLPDNLLNERKKGSDSIMVKQMADTVESKTENWILMSCISEWRGEFLRLAEKKGLKDITSEFLKNKDSKIKNLFEESIKTHEKSKPKDSIEVKYDSVFISVVRTVFGEDLFRKCEPEIILSVNIVIERFDKNTKFESYSVRTLMPGKMVTTNGFLDTKGEIQWTVKSEFFLAQNYQMWAESKISNTWAWIVSGIFLLFVMAGLVIKLIKK